MALPDRYMVAGVTYIREGYHTDAIRKSRERATKAARAEARSTINDLLAELVAAKDEMHELRVRNMALRYELTMIEYLGSVQDTSEWGGARYAFPSDTLPLQEHE